MNPNYGASYYFKFKDLPPVPTLKIGKTERSALPGFKLIYLYYLRGEVNYYRLLESAFSGKFFSARYEGNRGVLSVAHIIIKNDEPSMKIAKDFVDRYKAEIENSIEPVAFC